MKKSLLIASLIGLGCNGSTSQPTIHSRAGDPLGPPSMSVLPDPDIPLAKFSKTMRSGMELAEACLSIPSPPPPQGQNAEQISAWSKDHLEPWLREKSHAAQLARSDLAAAAEEQLRYRIMAGGIVALLHEDIARTLLAIPMPLELESEPEIAKIYNEVTEAEARPYLKHAKRAYLACALNAGGMESLAAWARFCHVRKRNLP